MPKSTITSQPSTNLSVPVHLPEKSFRDICERLPAMIAVYEVDTGKYSYVNQAITKLLGYSSETFVEGGVEFATSLIHPDDLGKIIKRNNAALNRADEIKSEDLHKESIVNFQYRMKHAEGRWIWMHTDGSVFNRKHGKVHSVLNVSVDITEQKETEDKLKKTNTKLETAERFALSQLVAKVGTFEWDLITNLVKWSPELETLHGLNPGSFNGKYSDVRKFIHPEDREKIQKEMKKTIENNKPFNCEYRVIKKDGTISWVLGRGEVIRDKKGKALRFVGANVDITDRKEVEDKLRASEERYQAFIHNSSEAIWRFELDKPIPANVPVDKQIKMMYERAYLAEANEVMAAMYGLKSVKKLIGARLSDLLIESDPANRQYLKTFIESDYALYNAESHEKDDRGKDKYFLNSLVGVIENESLVRAWGTQQDITEQRKAAEALRQSEERLALALKTSQLGIWEWDIKNDTLTWSEQLKKNYGLKPGDKITYERYLSFIHPDDVKHMQKNISKSLKSGDGYQIEHRIIWPDGTIHWILGQGQAFLENGKPVRMIGTSVNIDERKTTEQLKTQAAILSAEHKELLEINAAKDEFIALASHQLRTPATGVKQYIGMLLEGYAGKLTLTKEQLHMLSTAYESNERQLRIVNDLLLIAQLDAGKVRLNKASTNIVQVVREVVDEQSMKFKKKKQKVTYTYHKPQIKAEVDADRIRMAVENIIDNASKYSAEGTPISISVDFANKNVIVKIKDRGVGIDKKDRQKLFQKFSRIDNPLSTEAGGTGLGLYWANKIIGLHGGKLELSSKVSGGSTFTIILPKS